MTTEEARQMSRLGLEARRRNRAERGPRLSKREALIVRELALTPGRAVDWAILAAALRDEAPGSKYRVQAAVQRVRGKFGSQCIETHVGHGYCLPRAVPGVSP